MVQTLASPVSCIQWQNALVGQRLSGILYLMSFTASESKAEHSATCAPLEKHRAGLCDYFHFSEGTVKQIQ